MADIRVKLGIEKPVKVQFKQVVEIVKLGGSVNYIHTQSIASDVWVIEHPLQKFPSVTIIDTGDNVVFGDIQYINTGTIQITFSAAFSGKAYLN